MTIWVLATRVYDHAPEGVRLAVLTGALSRFLVDCAVSIASGTASNALFNMAILLVAVGPLRRPAA